MMNEKVPQSSLSLYLLKCIRGLIRSHFCISTVRTASLFSLKFWERGKVTIVNELKDTKDTWDTSENISWSQIRLNEKFSSRQVCIRNISHGVIRPTSDYIKVLSCVNIPSLCPSTFYVWQIFRYLVRFKSLFHILYEQKIFGRLAEMTVNDACGSTNGVLRLLGH